MALTANEEDEAEYGTADDEELLELVGLALQE